MSILKVTDCSFSFGNRVILENATFVMNKGEHIGLIGANGEGKTTFVKMLTGSLEPDNGKIEWCKRITTGYLDQYTKLTKGKTVRDILREAFQNMYELEALIMKYYDDMATASEEEINGMLSEIGDIQSELEHNGFYSLDAKIEEVANGLGLENLDKDVTDLSGGQRSKVLLTKLLLAQPMILILDEPTNFLDEDQVTWLKNYLLNYENAFILVSHDVPFLNSVVNVIYHMEDGALTRYTGNYNNFMDMYELKKEHQNIAYEKQQKEITKLETFIAKNKARVATTNLAKSRQRILDKMDIITKAKEQIKPSFNFKEYHSSGKFVFALDKLVIGYSASEPLSSEITLNITRGEKVAIKGANGIGKTTLLKTLLGELKPLSGTVNLDYNIKYGYFAQEELAGKNTALEEIWKMYPAMTNAEVRGSLAAMGLDKEKIESLVMVLSGGEAAKVRLCKIVLTETNILVLDEPTNHLDVMAKEALKEALIKYKGTVVLVCHEKEFYEGLVTRVIDAEEFTTKLL